MYIAHTLKLSVDNPPQPVTFTCQEHDPAQLVTYITRYQRVTNEVNKRDDVYQILSTSDLTQSLSMSTLTALGVIVLSRELINDLNRQKYNPASAIEIKPNDETKKLTIEELGIVDAQYYTLIDVVDDKSFQHLNPIARMLCMEKDETRFKLEFMNKSRGSEVITEWILLRNGEDIQRMIYPCFLKLDSEGVYSLIAEIPR